MAYLHDAYTDVGGRSNNEDAFFVGQSANGSLFAVADGLGGVGYGEVASAIAVEMLKRRFEDEATPFDLEEAFKAANEAILEKQCATGHNMKTTLCAAWVNRDRTVFAHVGDSRIYAFDEEAIVYQSVDHSAAQMAVMLGEAETSDLRSHPDRNLLTRALGASDTLKVEVRTVESARYHALLLCSDGFWEYVCEQEMLTGMRKSAKPNAWLRRMRKLLKKRIPRNHDNNTAVAVMKRGE